MTTGATPAHIQLGMTDAEFESVIALLGREPRPAELAMLSSLAMQPSTLMASTGFSTLARLKRDFAALDMRLSKCIDLSEAALTRDFNTRYARTLQSWTRALPDTRTARYTSIRKVPSHEALDWQSFHF